jgi:hypothetical protein
MCRYRTVRPPRFRSSETMKKAAFSDFQLVTPIRDEVEASGPIGESRVFPSLGPVTIEARTRSSIPPPLPGAAGRGRRGSLARWWAPMFFVFCVGAFLMMLGVVLGAKMVGPSMMSARLVNGAHAQQSVRESAIPAPSAPRVFEATGAVITLDLQQIVGGDEPAGSGIESPETAAGAAPRPRQKALSRKHTDRHRNAALPDEEQVLSEESRAMIQRMGAGVAVVPSQALAKTAGAAEARQPEGLGEEQLYRVISRGKRQLQRCYETALRYTLSDETIRLDVDLTVGLSGAVSRIRTRGRTLGDMDGCIERVIRAWRFPTAGRTTDTSFPLIFQPGK